MKKLLSLFFAMSCFLLSYGQNVAPASKDSIDSIALDQEQSIVVKYYQTTEPDGKKTSSKDELNSSDDTESSGLNYYETTEIDNEIDDLEEEVREIEAESTLSYFGDERVEVEENSEPEESIQVKYYQTVEPKPKKEQVGIIANNSHKKHRHSSNSYNEVKTLYARKHRNGGGYGGLGVKVSEFNDNTLVMGGIRAAWVINRSIGLGIDAWGVIPTVNYTDVPSAVNQDVALVGGYGGILFEPILFSNKVIHLIFPISTGMGWLGYQSYRDDYNFEDTELIDQDLFWYVEPSAAIEINIARFSRLNFGVSKRFILSVLPELYYLSEAKV